MLDVEEVGVSLYRGNRKLGGMLRSYILLVMS